MAPPKEKQGERKVWSESKKRNKLDNGEERYKVVKVLILTFKFNDLGLDKETEKVEQAFKSLNYAVEPPFSIDLQESQDGLEERLSSFLGLENSKEPESSNDLYIIYYHGHGGAKGSDGKYKLSFASHKIPNKVDRELRDRLWKYTLDYWEAGEEQSENKLKEISEFLDRKRKAAQKTPAKIDWPPIGELIMKSPHDTLVILDCCDAGLAAASSQRQDYDARDNRKELIGACGWGVGTRNHLSGALCRVLKNNLVKGSSNESKRPDMSTSTLVREMNNDLVRSFDPKGKGPPQAVHYMLQRSSKDKLVLESL